MPNTLIHDPTADAFMRRILANPADSLARLVFADWLDETGVAANMAWARYLRLADEVASAPDNDPRLPKLKLELDRVSGLVRARLRYPAQIFVAYPEAMLHVLPARNMDLNVERVQVPQAVRELLPESAARENLVLPLALMGDRLAVAIGGHRDPMLLLQTLRFILNREILPLRVGEDAVRTALAANYGSYDVESVDSPFYIFLTRIVDAARRLNAAPNERGADAIVIDTVSAILTDMAEFEVGELELLPTADDLQVRWVEAADYPLVATVQRRFLVPLATQLRAMARIPSWNAEHVQDGHLEFPYRNRLRHFLVRVSMTPHGPHIMLSQLSGPPEATLVLPAAA